MFEQNHTTDIVIVGAGLAGLTAALSLSKTGRELIVLEKSAQIGGRATSQNKAGFTFNLGPHAFYRAGEAFSYLVANDFDLPGGLPNQKGSLALTENETHPLPVGPGSFLQTTLLTIREKLQVSKALARLMKDKPEAYADVTIADYIDELVPAGRPKQLLHLLSKISTYANAPHIASADVLIMQYQRFARKNVLYLDHGWQAVVEQFATRLIAANVSLQTKTKVVSLQEHAHHVDVSLDDGTTIRANAVIIAAAPELAARLLPEADIRTEGQAINLASFEVALEGEHDPSFYFAGGLHKPYYYSVHSQVAKLAPTHHTLIHLAKYLTPAGANAAATESEFETLLDRLLPGWRQRLRHKRFLPNLRAVNRLTTAANGGLKERQPVKINGLTRTFLAGDWVGKDGWLVDASVASALKASELILATVPTTTPALPTS